MNKGKFIVIEGIDGAGTTTQTKMLVEHLNRSGLEAIESREPTNGPIGVMIRNILKGDLFPVENVSVLNEQLAYLFAADRYYHLNSTHDGVIEALNKGVWCITDRYIMSSVAYNTDSKEQRNLVEELNKNFIVPDLQIYISVPVNVALERIKYRESFDQYETESYLSGVISRYESEAKRKDGSVVVIDGTGSIDEIHQDIWNEVSKILQ